MLYLKRYNLISLTYLTSYGFSRPSKILLVSYLGLNVAVKCKTQYRPCSKLDGSSYQNSLNACMPNVTEWLISADRFFYGKHLKNILATKTIPSREFRGKLANYSWRQFCYAYINFVLLRLNYLNLKLIVIS